MVGTALVALKRHLMCTSKFLFINNFPASAFILIRVWQEKSFTALRLQSSLTHVLLCLQAVKEIQNLVETSNYLEEQKRRLIQIQSVYVKKLSLLTGAYNLCSWLHDVAFCTWSHFVLINVLFKSVEEN